MGFDINESYIPWIRDGVDALECPHHIGGTCTMMIQFDDLFDCDPEDCPRLCTKVDHWIELDVGDRLERF